MTARVARITVAVNNIEDALAFYREALGLTVTHEVELPDHDLRVVRLPIGDLEIELIQPTSASGPVARYLEQNGEGLHHLVLGTNDIELEMRTLLARGTELIDHEPRNGPDGRVAFISPRSTGGVLIELIEAREATRRETIGSDSDSTSLPSEGIR